MAISPEDLQTLEAIHGISGEFGDVSRVSNLGTFQTKSGQTYNKEFVTPIAQALVQLLIAVKKENSYAQELLMAIVNGSDIGPYKGSDFSLSKASNTLFAGGQAMTAHTRLVAKDMLSEDGKSLSVSHIHQQMIEDGKVLGFKINPSFYPNYVSGTRISAPETPKP
jgi:hypothetical protein